MLRSRAPTVSHNRVPGERRLWYQIKMSTRITRSVAAAVLVAAGLVIPHSSAAAQARAARTAARAPEPTGPIAVFDTTMGRMTCRLYSRQLPNTVANFVALAQGTKDWHDALNMTDVHGKPFYDGTAIAGIPDGIRGGDRFGGGEGAAGPPIPRENAPALTFDRPGRLAMATHAGKVSSSFFLITLHADEEFDKNKRGVVFGQCDDPSVEVAAKISHAMMSVGNRTTHAIAINKLRIVQPGEPLPPVAEDVPPYSIVPQPVPPSHSHAGAARCNRAHGHDRHHHGHADLQAVQPGSAGRNGHLHRTRRGQAAVDQPRNACDRAQAVLQRPAPQPRPP